ncbi:Branched-chain-amino-acid aminotransferase 1 [Pyrenophora tritici-repentis]|nr:Branched-chain-amino-acid aminotransferase 1 [Pyrenophora tritici-repentis]
MSPALNYGQQALEGFKAFRTPGDPGRIVLFRPNLNAIRFQHSSIVLSMPPVPVEMFLRACRAAVALNANYVPPYESGGALYVRPQLYGTSAHLGLSAPNDFDRAAPKGTGHAKVGGNYAPVIRWSDKARAEGFGITLHLDSVHHKEVDEFSSCAFIGVHSQGDSNITLVVPDSRCTIDSVTSDSVQHIAQQLGWKVEKRPVDYKELPSFSEVLGVGTSVVLIPIKSITRRSITQGMPSTPRLQVEAESEIITYLSEEQNKGGLVFSTLLNQLSAIQRGKAYDEFGWLFTVHEEDRNI